MDPRGPARVYAAGPVARSDDGGTTWQGFARYSLGQASPGNTAIALDPARPDHLLTGGISNAVIVESKDGGTGWQERWSLEQISPPPEDVGIQTINVIVFAPSDPTVVYAGTSSAGCIQLHEPCDDSFGVIISHDGGTSWQRSLDDHLRNVSVIDLAVDPTNVQIVYAAAETGLFKSTDGGASWKRINISGVPEESRIRTVAVSPVDSMVVLAGVDGLGVYVSTDGGRTWQEGVAGLEPNGSLHDILFDPTNPQVVYTSDYRSGVYRSTDGGLTWVKINNGLHVRASLGLAISADGQHLYVGIDGGGVFRLDLNGQPPAPVSGVATAAAAPTSTPPPAQPTAPPEATPAPTPAPAGGRGICGGIAALPLALLGLVLYRKSGK